MEKVNDIVRPELNNVPGPLTYYLSHFLTVKGHKLLGFKESMLLMKKIAEKANHLGSLSDTFFFQVY
jgi:hypothetical protein